MVVAVAQAYLANVPMVLVGSNILADTTMAMAAAAARMEWAVLEDILAEVALVPGQAGAAADWPISTTIQ
jgi:hypothetical protein